MKRAFLIFILFVGAGCGVFRSKQVIQTAPERKISNPFQNTQNEEKGTGIVVRRSYGLNSLEVLLPDSEQDSVVRYPLAELKKSEPPDPSAADQAVLKGREKELSQGERGKEEIGSEISQAKKPHQTESYLLGIAKVKDLYRNNQYELALVHLEPLVELFPDDVRLLSLRGTIAQKLGFNDMAKESWAQVLKLQPNNYSVQTALNRVQGGHQIKKTDTQSDEKTSQ